MRVLEARFHRKSGADYLVVGRLLWAEGVSPDRPTVELASSLELDSEPTAMLSKLRYLVSATAPEPFERLQRLRSRFWSFVEIDAGTPKGASATK